MSQNDEIHEQVESILHRIGSSGVVCVSNFWNRSLHLFGLALQNSTCELLSIMNERSDYNFDADDAHLISKYVRTSETLKKIKVSAMRSEPLVHTLLLAAAANPNIQEVWLEEIPALEGMVRMILEQSNSLTTLNISGNGARLTSDIDLSTAFRQNRTLQCLYLRFWNFEQTAFRVYAEATNASPSLISLVLFHCNFGSSSTQQLLEVVCQGKSDLQELTIGYGCVFHDKTLFLLNVIQSRPSSTTLKKLTIYAENSEIKSLVQPFQEYDSSRTEPLLECMGFRNISCDNFYELVSNLPTTRGMKHIIISYRKGNIINMLNAIRKNFCLTSVQFNPKFRDQNMNNTLYRLGRRNEIIQRWRNSPLEMPKKHLYFVLATCLQYEFKMEIIFDLLHKHWRVLMPVVQPHNNIHNKLLLHKLESV